MRKIATVFLATFLLAGCGDGQVGSKAAYTGRFLVDSETEYVALERASTIGGACEGWNAISIQKPNRPETGMTQLLCWKRAGQDIKSTTKSGGEVTSSPASVWSD